jgi:hypothetical protein
MRKISNRIDFWNAVSRIPERINTQHCICGTCNVTHGSFFEPFSANVSVVPTLSELPEAEKRERFFSVLEKAMKALHPEYIHSRPRVVKEHFVYYGECELSNIIAAVWTPLAYGKYKNVALYAEIQTKNTQNAYDIALGVVCKNYVNTIFASVSKDRHFERNVFL